jgi:predicted Zn-dependent peptidase
MDRILQRPGCEGSRLGQKLTTSMHTVIFTCLRNGLRVVTIQRPYLHKAVVGTWIGVGSRHENKITNGISHFLEHMLFRGTRRRPSAAAFNHQIESLGGSMNAATHADFTRFDLTVPSEALAEGCRELGEIFTSPMFSDQMVEKGIVREEILEDLDENGLDVNADNALRSFVFPKHPLGMPLAGTERNVAKFSEKHLRSHLDQYYVGRNMAVVIVSSLGHKNMIRAATKAFEGIAPGNVPTLNPFRVRQSRARLRFVDYSAGQTSVRIGFPTPGQRSPQARAIDLLLRVLDDGMSTRLHRRICDERGLAYEVSAGTEYFDDVGLFEVGATVANASVSELVREVMDILGDLAVNGPTRAEVEKAHRRFAFDVDAMEDEAQSLAEYYGTADSSTFVKHLLHVAARFWV